MDLVLPTVSEINCVTKCKYVTKKSALNTISLQYKLNGAVLYKYKCPHCRYFHLTKTAQKD